jgi:hypothetical protein
VDIRKYEHRGYTFLKVDDGRTWWSVVGMRTVYVHRCAPTLWTYHVSGNTPSQSTYITFREAVADAVEEAKQ